MLTKESKNKNHSVYWEVKIKFRKRKTKKKVNNIIKNGEPI